MKLLKVEFMDNEDLLKNKDNKMVCVFPSGFIVKEEDLEYIKKFGQLKKINYISNLSYLVNGSCNYKNEPISPYFYSMPWFKIINNNYLQLAEVIFNEIMKYFKTENININFLEDYLKNLGKDIKKIKFDQFILEGEKNYEDIIKISIITDKRIF